MALVPHKITALAESDADGTDGKNIVAGAVVSLYDQDGNAINLYDDADGTNPSTAKTTDSTGQVVVWVTQGEYDEEVNGSTKRKVTVGGDSPSVIDTFANLEFLRPTREGQSFICVERAFAKYVLQNSDYTALSGDVTFANGRIGQLQIGENIYVEQFGAVIEVDSSTEIQDAIDRAYVSGGTLTSSPEVIFGAGTYIASEITINPRSKISGQGRESTILQLPDGGGDYIFADLGYVADSAFATPHITINDIGFDGNKANNPSTVALVICKTYRAEFVRCRFSNSSGAGCLYTSRASGGANNVNGLAENTWFKCTFNANDGAGLHGTDFGNNQLADATINECIFNQNSITQKLADIYMERSAGFKVLNNQLYGGGFSNIHLISFSRGIVSGNHCDLDCTNATTSEEPAAIRIQSFSAGGSSVINNNPIYLDHDGDTSGATPSALDLAGTTESLTVVGNSISQDGSNGQAYRIRGLQTAAKYNNSIDSSIDAGENLYDYDVVDAGQEFGTFTPTLSFATPGDSSFTYNTQSGSYVRDGLVVNFSVSLDFNTNAYTTASGRIQISGLPFDAEQENIDVQIMSLGQCRNITYSGLFENALGMGAQIVDSSDIITLFFNVAGASPQQIGTDNLPASTNFLITISGTYVIQN